MNIKRTQLSFDRITDGVGWLYRIRRQAYKFPLSYTLEECLGEYCDQKRITFMRVIDACTFIYSEPTEVQKLNIKINSVNIENLSRAIRQANVNLAQLLDRPAWDLSRSHT